MTDRRKSEADPERPLSLDGLVVRSTGSWHEVRAQGRVISSKIRGKFRLSGLEETNPVAVGDLVTVSLNEDDTGVITDIHARKNKLSRRAAGRKVGREHVIVANVDTALVIQSVCLPKPNPGFIDRFLAMAEYHELQAGIVVNKIDLMREQDRERVHDLTSLYSEIGYPVYLISALSGEGVDTLSESIDHGISVLAGPSGVGKSTLLNTLAPSLKLPTATVSEKTRKGRHTTSFAALHPISEHGYVVDTPGIREYGIVDIDPADLEHYFIEFRAHLNECHYPNCTHNHEPKCAIKEALDRGEISTLRYRSYLNILESLEQGERDVGR